MPVGMPGGCGVGRGFTVLAGDVVDVDVCVPAWVVVVLFTVAVGVPVAAVCLRDRVLGPALCEPVVAAVPWVFSVSCFREELVAAAVVPVVACDLL